MTHIKNDLLLRTLSGQTVERPPVWLMRQAGRILPDYRAIRASVSGFKALVEDPDLAATVTLQPVDQIGVDAAIIFSDILVIPEAMGLPYFIKESVGPRFDRTIQSRSDILALQTGEDAAGQLQYVYDALKETKKRLDQRVPLIGFAGAPWTLLAYMIEGGGSKTFSKARSFLYKNPYDAMLLLEKLTQTIIAYLKQKVESGADVIQIFDSWAGLLNRDLYRRFCMPFLQTICEALPNVPLILFAKGAWFSLQDLANLPVQSIGIDWQTPPDMARNAIGPDLVLQGNLDPTALYGSTESISDLVKIMIQQFGRRHIVNLGHGVYPDTPLEHVKAFVHQVQATRYAVP